jgi:malic enzyme
MFLITYYVQLFNSHFSFGGVDSFDIEINESDPQKFIDIVVSLEPTFGGINLEDIKVSHHFLYSLLLIP